VQPSPPNFDPSGLFQHIREQAAATVALCDQALAALQASSNIPFTVPEESTDPDDYRRDRKRGGHLNPRGVRVMEAFLRAGFTDEAVATFMTISTQSVARHRRHRGLGYGHRSKR
jgi:hypothetical protein